MGTLKETSQKMTEGGQELEPVNLQSLVEALRCSATPSADTKLCESCPYQLLEEVSEEELEAFKKAGHTIRPDMIKDGKYYWDSCDCDRMVLDAAGIIETLITKEE